MKKIEAFVRHEQIGSVKEALLQIGHRSMINYDIWYRGTEKEINQNETRGNPLYDFMPKVKLELVVDDASVPDILDAICKSAHTGYTGDSKIFVLPVEEAIRIQTKESGDMIL